MIWKISEEDLITIEYCQFFRLILEGNPGYFIKEGFGASEAINNHQDNSNTVNFSLIINKIKNVLFF